MTAAEVQECTTLAVCLVGTFRVINQLKRGMLGLPWIRSQKLMSEAKPPHSDKEIPEQAGNASKQLQVLRRQRQEELG